jgi:hypothetical protein
MVGAEAASSLLSTSTAPDFTAADELFRTFRAAAARGEEAYLSLTFREGKAGASLKLGTAAGPPAAAARPRAAALPAVRPNTARRRGLQPAAANPTPTCATSPPAGGRRGPRSRGPGALLRDERRRHLRIAPEVLARTGWEGRCPPPTVHRPTLPAPALDPGQVERREEEQAETPAPVIPPPASPPALAGPAVRPKVQLPLFAAIALAATPGRAAKAAAEVVPLLAQSSGQAPAGSGPATPATGWQDNVQRQSLEALKLPQLKALCKARKLPCSGVKAKLVARLCSDSGTPAKQPD